MNRPKSVLVQRPTPTPARRVLALLRRKIESGALGPGARVPSTRRLAKELGVAPVTAAKALTALAQEGLVVAVPRVGTVVAAAPEPYVPSSPRRREPAAVDVTRQDVVRAALAIADSDGLTAVSMRSVASSLGIAPMSLYRHVRDKADLVAWMTDEVFRELDPPSIPKDDWRARLEVAARLQWLLYRAHPWLAQVVSLTRPEPLPHVALHAEWILASLDGLGLDAVAMLQVHMLLFSFVRGIAINIEDEKRAESETGLTEEQWMQSREEDFARIGRAGGLTTFTRVVAEVQDEPDGFGIDAIFEFGLPPFLDGVAGLIARPPRRPSKRR